MKTNKVPSAAQMFPGVQRKLGEDTQTKCLKAPGAGSGSRIGNQMYPKHSTDHEQGGPLKKTESRP
jgi:hypothetical protein